MTTLLIKTSSYNDYEEGYQKANLTIHVTAFDQKETAQSTLVKEANEDYQNGINIYDPEGRPDFEYLSDTHNFAQLHSEDAGTVWLIKEILDTTKSIVTLTDDGSSQVIEFPSRLEARVFFEEKKECFQRKYPVVVAENVSSFAVEQDNRSYGDWGFANIQYFDI